MGFGTVYVAVPGSWSHNRVECGHPVENTVVYPDATRRCDPRRVPAVDVPISSVRFSSPPSSPVPLGELRQINEVGGNVVFATTPERRQGLIHEVVVVLQAHVLMDVRTPDERVLDDIVDSLQPVPPGYTVVPAVVGHSVNESMGLLDSAGLKVGGLYVELLPGARRSLQPAPLVTRQSVASGSLVPVGSSVGLAFPGYN